MKFTPIPVRAANTKVKGFVISVAKPLLANISGNSRKKLARNNQNAEAGAKQQARKKNENERKSRT
jgi:hypothetical protein